MNLIPQLILTAAMVLLFEFSHSQNTCATAVLADLCNTSFSGSTVGVPNDNATSGAGDCYTAIGSGGQQWYKFSLPIFESSTVTISTAFPGTNFDTKIHVYSVSLGLCGTPTCIAGDDDSGGNLTSSVSFDATWSVFSQYYIRIGGYQGAEGNFEVQIDFQNPCPVPGCTDPAACNYNSSANVSDNSCYFVPGNDGFFAAYPLSFPGIQTIDNRCTFENYDVDACTGSETKDVWYTFYYAGGTIYLYTTSQIPVPNVLDDTAILVYDYFFGYPVACNDDYAGFSSRLVLDCSELTYGNLYFVQVSGYNGATGVFNLVSDHIDSPGCTNPSALNYDPCASVDDGDCDFGCLGDLNSDGTVNVTDLLLFASNFGNTCY